MGSKASKVKDLVSESEKKGKRYEKVISDYVKRLFLKKKGGLL
jgi:hypothetical protein